MKRKIGPLPVWAWLGSLAVGVAWLLYNRAHPKQAASAGDAVLDPTGTGGYGPIDPQTGIPYQFEVPAGVASGGSSGALTAQDQIANVTGLVSALEPLFALGAPAPGESQYPSGVQEVQDVSDILTAIRPLLPATSTGGGASKPIAHHPKKAKINQNKSNPRYGKQFKTVKNYHGKKGTFHVYKNGRAVRVG
jgi:hypothetical protein